MCKFCMDIKRLYFLPHLIQSIESKTYLKLEKVITLVYSSTILPSSLQHLIFTGMATAQMTNHPRSAKIARILFMFIMQFFPDFGYYDC